MSRHQSESGQNNTELDPGVEGGPGPIETTLLDKYSKESPTQYVITAEEVCQRGARSYCYR